MSGDGRPEYANAWEDTALDLEVLEPRAGERAVCVTSGGCMALALAAAGAHVVAVDVAFPQTALLALKLQALQSLPLQTARDFLGVRCLGRADAAVNRADLYRSFAGRLSPDARAYWDRHEIWIRRGVLDQGWTEVFMGLVRRAYHWLVHDRAMCERWFALQDESERRSFFREHWDTRRRRLFLRLALSPRLLGRVYKTASVYADVAAPHAVLERRLDAAMLERTVADNFFLARLFTGCFLTGERGVPPYLGDPLGANLGSIDRERIEMRTQSLFEVLERAEPASLDLFALSNVVDWMDRPQQERLFQLVLRSAASDARLMIRSVFSGWEPPASLASRLTALAASAGLAARERSIVYGAVLGYRLGS
jgi:S-adenosylmethionine-diacylglycerol 3-amino-3-carboxypropyl transferase